MNPMPRRPSTPRQFDSHLNYANGERPGQRERDSLVCMAEWWSIEVFDSELQAALRWKDSYRTQLVEAAITAGAANWNWIEHKSGVVFEVCFAAEDRWESFRNLAIVTAALDAVPDPAYGLLVYRGRGGSAGARQPKRPKPTAGAGAMELPEPTEQRVLNVTSAELAGLHGGLAGGSSGADAGA